MEPTTVGSLWLENDLHENELEFETHMGRSKKNVRVTSDRIHAEIHEVWTCVAPAAPSLCHTAVNPCLKFSWRESPWNWSCNSANLRKSTVTWMSRHYVFTVTFRWSTFSSTINLCNINCVGFSETHCSYGPPILWHSPFHAGVSRVGARHFQNGVLGPINFWKMGSRLENRSPKNLMIFFFSFSIWHNYSLSNENKVSMNRFILKKTDWCLTREECW